MSSIDLLKRSWSTDFWTTDVLHRQFVESHKIMVFDFKVRCMMRMLDMSPIYLLMMSGLLISGPLIFSIEQFVESHKIRTFGFKVRCVIRMLAMSPIYLLKMS